MCESCLLSSAPCCVLPAPEVSDKSMPPRMGCMLCICMLSFFLHVTAIHQDRGALLPAQCCRQQSLLHVLAWITLHLRRPHALGAILHTPCFTTLVPTPRTPVAAVAAAAATVHVLNRECVVAGAAAALPGPKILHGRGCGGAAVPRRPRVCHSHSGPVPRKRGLAGRGTGSSRCAPSSTAAWTWHRYHLLIGPQSRTSASACLALIPSLPHP